MMYTRRQFLSSMLTVAAGYPLLSFANNQPKTRNTHAKSIIQIWMWGGPSHLDTFDPKPEAGRDFCGPLNQPIKTNVSGLRIAQEFPQMAKIADKYSLIRSMTHEFNAHESAAYLMQTGRRLDGQLVAPGIGSVIAMMKGKAAARESRLPPYTVLTTPQGRFSMAGFLPSKYKPFVTGGDPNSERFLVDGYVVKGVDQNRQLSRRQMLNQFEQTSMSPMGDQLNAIESPRNRAYDQIMGDDIKTFDLSLESEAMREAYGRNWFGQACLAARRLVEKGVPYITINYRGWDSHKGHFNTLKRNNPLLDQGLAMLIRDLSDRGLLDQTIVWWGGEFGRTPRVQWEAPWNGGRGHFGRCFTHLVAGGGFKGGTVVGASNKTGEEVADRPVYPQDLLGSFYELMGIDPDAPMPNEKGIDLPFMAKASKYGRLHEIMKS